jgi:uridine phosphorylase
MDWPENLPLPYAAEGDEKLIHQLKYGNALGITITSSGFYGPQGRQLRAIPAVDGLNDRFAAFEHEGLRVTNYEMETSALYGLAGMLGHRAATICAVVANRHRKEYSRDHHAAIERMIDQVLERVTA